MHYSTINQNAIFLSHTDTRCMYVSSVGVYTLPIILIFRRTDSISLALVSCPDPPLAIKKRGNERGRVWGRD